MVTVTSYLVNTITPILGCFTMPIPELVRTSLPIVTRSRCPGTFTVYSSVINSISIITFFENTLCQSKDGLPDRENPTDQPDWVNQPATVEIEQSRVGGVRAEVRQG